MERRPPVLAALGLALLTGLLHTLAFPPYPLPETAYVCVAPLAYWLLRHRRPWRTTALVAFAGFGLSWLVLLAWLRHVTIPGWLLLAPVLALFPTVWALLARYLLHAHARQTHGHRLLNILALAAAWMLLETLRTYLFTGFPWLPLAASQWQRPALLQPSALLGSGYVSALLITFNLSLASYLARLPRRAALTPLKPRLNPHLQHTPELPLTLALVLAAFLYYLQQLPTPHQREPLFSVGIVQPDIAPTLKWDENEALHIAQTLSQQTHAAAEAGADLVLWPESATPLPLHGSADMQAYVEALVRETRLPLLTGSMAYENDRWYNTLALVTPDTGLDPRYYAKRHLVPFGEYIPRWLRRLNLNIGNLVGFSEDFESGTDPHPLPVVLAGRLHHVAPLICYEDIFPDAPRQSLLAHDASVLVTVTNNAWYGQEGAAEQHAAHAVLRAIETRRPVLRASNNGWSGWFDEYGHTRATLRGPDHSLHHRLTATLPIDHDPRHFGQQTPHTRYGPLLQLPALGLLLLALLRQRRQGPEIPPAP